MKYVNEIITTAHKLNEFGFRISDEWVGVLFTGVPDEYRVMIMDIESSGMLVSKFYKNKTSIRCEQNFYNMKTCKSTT